MDCAMDDLQECKAHHPLPRLGVMGVAVGRLGGDFEPWPL